MNVTKLRKNILERWKKSKTGISTGTTINFMCTLAIDEMLNMLKKKECKEFEDSKQCELHSKFYVCGNKSCVIYGSVK